jgi:hypothetical protein
MPCETSQNTLNPPLFPGVSIPGYGFPFAPPQVPLPAFDLPTDLLADLIALMEQLGALFPSGLFKAIPDGGMQTVLDFIANILSQIAPFLSLYNFFMAALNLFVCIIEVLCALPNPIAVAFKLKKLFAECLPPFLNLFPWLALLAMILALILLIIALAEYILEKILAIIRDILANLVILGKAQFLLDEEAILAAAQKLAISLCFIENLFAIFLAIAAVMAVIQSLMEFAGLSICSDSDTDDQGCCTEANCPDFIADNPNGISGTEGKLFYLREVETDFVGLLGVPAGTISADPLRLERWQFLNEASTQAYPFSDIITPVDTTTGKIYFPDIEFEADTPLGRAPYLVDIRFSVNPAIFDPTDTSGTRYMRVQDCIVVRKPYLGELDFENVLDTTNSTGTLNLEGGLVFEDDGETPFNINGVQATLNTFIHFDSIESTTGLPIFDDGYAFNDVEFTLNFNHDALADNNLVTVGCFPGLSVERAVQNAILATEGLESVAEKLENANLELPNVIATQACVVSALNVLRQDVSVEKVTLFGLKVTDCMTSLIDDSLDFYCGALPITFSEFNSTFTLDTDTQFTTRSIEVTVILKDATGTTISTGIPDTCLDELLEKLKAIVTFGEVTDFIYDGETSFIAYISSEASGTGTITIEFDGKVLQEITVGTDLDTPSTISPISLPYTFIDTATTPAVRRDATDVSNDGVDNG